MGEFRQHPYWCPPGHPDQVYRLDVFFDYGAPRLGPVTVPASRGRPARLLYGSLNAESLRISARLADDLRSWAAWQDSHTSTAAVSRRPPRTVRHTTSRARDCPTLRHWDAEGRVVPDRDPVRGTRRYTPAQVRDARIVHQLRKAGYRITRLRSLIPELRQARRSADITSALAARDTDIAARSRALLDGAAALSAVLAPATEEPPVRG